VSAAWPRRLKRRFYGDHVITSRDLNSTPTLVEHVVASLDKALYNGFGFVQNIAPPSLSRDRRIKVEQTNIIIINLEMKRIIVRSLLYTRDPKII